MTKPQRNAPPWKKYFIAGWAFVECLLFSGILYGWSSLVFVLKEEGIYADLCDQSNPFLTNSVNESMSLSHDDVEVKGKDMPLANSSNSYNVHFTTVNKTNFYKENESMSNEWDNVTDISLPCRPQDSMLALCFTIGSSLFCASCVVMGHINYKFGTRITRLIAFVFFMFGSLCLAFVSKGKLTDKFDEISIQYFLHGWITVIGFRKKTPWLIFPGLSCIGIGGLPLLVTNTQVSNLFNKDRSTVVGLLVGGYDMSSVIFLFVKLAHQNGLYRRYSYFILTGLHVMTLISTFLFLPRSFITFNDTNLELELTISDDKKIAESLLRRNKQKARRPSLADPQPLNSYIKQPMFISHLVWVCLLQLRFYYFLGNLNTFLNRILEEDKSQVSHFTNVCFYTMMFGLVTSFFAGIVYDRQKRFFAKGRTRLYRSLMPAICPLMTASSLAILLSILVLLPYTVLLYPMFVIMVLFRSFLYALVTAFISAIFPSEFFAMLYGITIVSAGVFSCLQYALFQWAESYSSAPFHAEVFLLCLSIISLVHPTYMWVACWREESREK